MKTSSEPGTRIGRILLALTASGAAALGAGALILTRPFAEAPREQGEPHPESIYRGAGGWVAAATKIPPVVSPFHLHTDPMAGLFLANFAKDPDRIYLGFEPQSFDDEIHGRGLLVIGWRVDGWVDVFHSPGLRLDPGTYGIAGKGLHRMEERPFADARFELGPDGALVDLEFEDLEGRPVRVLVRETDTRPRRPFAFLAPMGGAASDPPALPLVFVHDFYFVRRAGSEVRIEIDGRAHRGDPFPLLLDGTRVHFHRYSPDPFIATWNPTTGAIAEVLDVRSGSSSGPFDAESRGVRYELAANGEFREIRRMSRSEGEHEVSVEFDPAFPHLLALRDGAEVSGSFRISADPTAGTIAGGWSVIRRGGELHMEAIPDGGWTPGDTPRVARVIFRMVSTFRAWPTTYRWRATLPLPPPGQQPEGSIPLQSVWERME